MQNAIKGLKKYKVGFPKKYYVLRSGLCAKNSSPKTSCNIVSHNYWSVSKYFSNCLFI